MLLHPEDIHRGLLALDLSSLLVVKCFQVLVEVSCEAHFTFLDLLILFQRFFWLFFEASLFSRFQSAVLCSCFML